MSRPPQRPITRLLIANRGEIATRIISSARELSIPTYALYTSGDASHAAKATHVIQVPSSATFMNIQALIDLVKKHEIDAVHPGYGFLSESEEFSRRMWEEAGAVVVGPGWGILAGTGDKLRARMLAEECNVPVCPALSTSTSNASDILKFAKKVGYPIMVKAVDGGGGRGIRLIRNEASLPSAVKRAVEESPSKQLFAEKAAVDGFRHMEVQIIGDGKGGITHLWERECSIQRRYQKIVEVAPSVVGDRKLVAKIIEDALRMARHIQYFSLGTFEFLVNPVTKEYYFLEVNPRLQVEHTITESISMTDIVKTQLLLAQGANLDNCGLPDELGRPEHPPSAHSIQLRLTSENVQSNWTLSIGKITSFQLPSGNGIRVDTHLINEHPSVVSAEYDSLLAKLIITASSWPDVVSKAQRALSDTQISGVKTNLDILRGIVAHPDFLAGKCDTQWLESKQSELLHNGQQISSSESSTLLQDSTPSSSAPAISTANTLFRRGDAWSLTLAPPKDPKNTSNAAATPPPHHLELTRILRNEFPTSLSAEIMFTSPATSSSPQRKSTPYTLTLSSTNASASAATSHHRRGNASDGSHVNIPFPGKLVEVLVDEGDMVREGDVVCVVQQMKMELEVRSHRSGRVTWVTEAEDGEEVGEGMLVAVVEEGREARL
ncbi:carbamoyl-phosphate synthase L chain, ATP binding domain-domain-containing protein [Clohesyomyces aquaticus]|uniref:Carbamoyl-phosphate synthase L chain, ATP binding domain-domain-containing protein n=1 Tax=Clohesyomyces aquaticus TaxID=1231657 RepID=A0A1Y1ZM77_9PLEO|nr:carbamoyl-phosphate synthase L chain, ATP binding domain-domain-containing protein [Clohesyomyces aquaticus]